MGVPTGFQDLDNLTGGLHDSEFVVLAARPSMGKTALATNIAENVAIEANVPVLFVSLEMARLELAQRMLCSQGGSTPASSAAGSSPARTAGSWSRCRPSSARRRCSSTTRPART